VLISYTVFRIVVNFISPDMDTRPTNIAILTTLLNTHKANH